METAKKTYYIVFRVCLMVLFALAELLFWLILIPKIVEGSVLPWEWVLAILGQAVLFLFRLQVMCRFPWVAFAEDGICVMLFFRGCLNFVYSAKLTLYKLF